MQILKSCCPKFLSGTYELLKVMGVTSSCPFLNAQELAGMPRVERQFADSWRVRWRYLVGIFQGLKPRSGAVTEIIFQYLLYQLLPSLLERQATIQEGYSRLPL